jgi:tRNA-uridine 2-sulfurtransferase
MEADFVATGHYAQIKKSKAGIYKLSKGKDKKKDQSYFLWRLGQEQLARIIFPVGCFEKDEVRKLAKKWKLPSALTPESQEVCFANGDIDKFLEKHCGTNPGDIIDKSGKTIGQHQGLWFHTMGQRRGIKLSGGPFYVVKKDIVKNELVVSASLGDLKTVTASVEDARWIRGTEPALPLKAKARIRYRGKDAAMVLSMTKGGYRLKFLKPQLAVSPGQSAVFYRGRELLGGGIISLP